jgi:homoserine O-acetyltransferase
MASDTHEFVEYFWEPAFIHHDANNLLAMLWTWQHGDVSDNPLRGGDLAKALGSITARTIILPGPADCESAHNIDPMDMKSIKRLECRSAPGPRAETQPYRGVRRTPSARCAAVLHGLL